MMKRTPIWALLALLLAACPAPTGTAQPGTGTQERLPPLSAEARQAKPVPYSRTVALTWPRDARKLQLVISGGWQPDERFAWMIADGTKLVAVYRLGTREDLSDLLVKLAQGSIYATTGGVQDTRSWSIAGAVPLPNPPPPPEPGGFPPEYLERVFAGVPRRADQPARDAVERPGRDRAVATSRP